MNCGTNSAHRMTMILRPLWDYHLAEGYLNALAASVRHHWAQHGRAEKLIVSFHGTPQRYADQGDPYRLQCERTAKALAQRLELTPEQWMLSFQSRFGRAPWLRPYTDETLRSLAQQGTQHVDVVCPGSSWSLVPSGYPSFLARIWEIFWKLARSP